METNGAGSYVVTVTALGNGTTFLDGEESLVSLANIKYSNQEPIVVNVVPDQNGTVDNELTIELSNVFADADNDTITITANKGTVHGTMWSYTPIVGDAGTAFSVTLTANDGKGGTVQDTFMVTVAALSTPITDLRFESAGGGFERFPFIYWTRATGATSVTPMVSTDSGLTWTVADTAQMPPTATSASAQLWFPSAPTSSYRVKLVVVGGDKAGDSNIVTLTN